MGFTDAVIGALVGGRRAVAIKGLRLNEAQEQRLSLDDDLQRRRGEFDLLRAQQRAPVEDLLLQSDLQAKQLAARDAGVRLKALKQGLSDEYEQRGMNQLLERLGKGGNLLKLQAEIANQEAQAKESGSRSKLYDSQASESDFLNSLTSASQGIEQNIEAPAALLQQRNRQVSDSLVESLWNAAGQQGTPPGSVYDLISGDFDRAWAKAGMKGLPQDDSTRKVIANALVAKYAPQVRGLLQGQQGAQGADATPGSAPIGGLTEPGSASAASFFPGANEAFLKAAGVGITGGAAASGAAALLPESAASLWLSRGGGMLGKLGSAALTVPLAGYVFDPAPHSDEERAWMKTMADMYQYGK